MTDLYIEDPKNKHPCHQEDPRPNPTYKLTCAKLGKAFTLTIEETDCSEDFYAHETKCPLCSTVLIFTNKTNRHIRGADWYREQQANKRNQEFIKGMQDSFNKMASDVMLFIAAWKEEEVAGEDGGREKRARTE